MKSIKRNLESDGMPQGRFFARISPSIKKSEPSLTLSLPEETRVKKSPGYVKRSQLGNIYNQFIDAYQAAVARTGIFVPSVFLIYSEHNNLKEGPVATTINLALASTEEEIEQMFNVIVKSFPADRFTLEMMMYANKADDTSNGETIAVIGARDLGGNTIHTVLSQEKTTVKTKLVPKSTVGNLLHKWMPPSIKSKKDVSLKSTSVTDDFLNMLATRYAVASSTSLLEQNVTTN